MAQQSAYLNSKTKFHMSNPKAESPYNEQQFFKWSNDNFYRTSTNDMSQKVRTPPPHLAVLSRFLLRRSRL